MKFAKDRNKGSWGAGIFGRGRQDWANANDPLIHSF